MKSRFSGNHCTLLCLGVIINQLSRQRWQATHPNDIMDWAKNKEREKERGGEGGGMKEGRDLSMSRLHDCHCTVLCLGVVSSVGRDEQTCHLIPPWVDPRSERVLHSPMAIIMNSSMWYTYTHTVHHSHCLSQLLAMVSQRIQSTRINMG